MQVKSYSVHLLSLKTVSSIINNFATINFVERYLEPLGPAWGDAHVLGQVLSIKISHGQILLSAVISSGSLQFIFSTKVVRSSAGL